MGAPKKNYGNPRQRPYATVVLSVENYTIAHKIQNAKHLRIKTLYFV